MKSKVYFANMRTRSGRNLLDKTAALFEAAGFGKLISPKDLVAVKIHVGEPGNLAYIAPPLVRTVVDKIKAKGGRPFITDANTLYVGRRSNAVDHMVAAYENGFSYATIGAPFIVADGLTGHEAVTLPVPEGKWVKEAKVAAALVHADALIALTHFKGHQATGFGGVFKNIGMGGASRAGKQIQHSNVKPRTDAAKCTGCSRCVRHCPAGAIVIDKTGKAYINHKLCIGCAECTITCNNEAIAINWEEGAPGALQEKMVEYALALLKQKQGKAGFINFVMNVSPDCDCIPWNDTPIVPDIGILASLDPVALDQASVDLVNSAPGMADSKVARDVRSHDKFRTVHRTVDWRVQLEYAESLGMGTRDYELVEIS